MLFLFVMSEMVLLMITSWHETLSALPASCRGNPPIAGEFPLRIFKAPEGRSFRVLFLLAWTICWNNRIAGDLRCCESYCNLNVMRSYGSRSHPTSLLLLIGNWYPLHGRDKCPMHESLLVLGRHNEEWGCLDTVYSHGEYGEIRFPKVLEWIRGTVSL